MEGKAANLPVAALGLTTATPSPRSCSSHDQWKIKMLSPSLEVLSWSRHLSSNNWCELLGALRCQDVRGLHPCPGLHITLLAPHLPLQVACAEGPTGNGNSAAVLFLEVIASYRGQSTPAENTGEAPSCGKFLASRAVKAALLTRINIQPK